MTTAIEWDRKPVRLTEYGYACVQALRRHLSDTRSYRGFVFPEKG